MQEMQKMWVQSLGQKDPLEKKMVTHSSILVWRIPWTEKPGEVHGVARVGHNWVTSLSLFTFMHWRRKWQPTPVFLPGESPGQRSLVGCTSMGLHRVGDNWSNLAEAAAAAAAAAAVAKSCPILFNFMDYSPLDYSSSVHGIFQARILEWVTIFFSRRTSQPRDRTHTFCASCINKQILHHWATTWLIRVYSLPINMYLLPFWGSLFWTHKFRFPITNCSCHLCIHNNLSHNIYQSIEWCHLFLNCKYPSLDSNFIFISVTWYSKVIYKLMNEYRYLCCA